MDSCKLACLELQTRGEKVGKKSVKELQQQEQQQEKSQPQPLLSPNEAQQNSPTNSLLGNISSSNNLLSISHEDVNKPYDVIIFGASGSVGKFLVEEMALVVEKYYSSGQQSQQSPITSSADIREIRDPIQFAQHSCRSRKQSVPAAKLTNTLRWAIAGRSASKLSDSLCRAELSTGIKDLSLRVPVLLADLNHDRSLLELCSKTNLVINCVGPYAFGAEVLIKACLEKRTNYIDLCHENTFIERIRQEYDEAARAAQIFIINGCGFQSMSAEMGLNFAKQVVDGQVDEVKIILNLNDSHALIKASSSSIEQQVCSSRKSSGIITNGMWHSFLTEREQQLQQEVDCRNHHRQQKNRKGRHRDEEMTKEELNNSLSLSSPGRQLLRQDTQSLVRDIVQFKNRVESFSWIQLVSGFQEAGKTFCLPISSLTSEECQLTRSEMTNYELRKPDVAQGCWKPIRCSSFISLGSLTQVVLLSIWLLIFNMLIKFSPIRRLLRALPPHLSSMGFVNNKSSVAETQIQRNSLGHIKFCQTFSVYGIPGEHSSDPLMEREKHSRPKREQLLVTRIVGPEPNHVATATYAIQAAIALITEVDHLPNVGGVLTPGVAFAETNIIYQLRRRNLKFEIMKKA